MYKVQCIIYNVHVTFTRVEILMENESFHVNHNHSCDRMFLHNSLLIIMY